MQDKKQSGFIGVIILILIFVSLVGGLTFLFGGINSKKITQEKIIVYEGGKESNGPQAIPAIIKTPSPSISPSPDHVYVLEIDPQIDLNFGSKIENITLKFYEKYPDIYDFMAIFPLFLPKSEADGVAYSSNIQNNVYGICREIRKPCYWGECGSNKLLNVQIFSYKKNNYQELSKNPEDIINTLLHEIGHQWSVSTGNYKYSTTTLGINPKCAQDDIGIVKQESDHWSKGLQMPDQAVGVVEETLPWVDRGNGIFTFDTSLYLKPRKYHPFDLYLMGLKGKQEVNQNFLLLTNMSDYSEYNLPSGEQLMSSEIAVKASVREVTIEDLLRFTGEPRSPSSDKSQKNFKTAFLILTKKGEKPSGIALETITRAANLLPLLWFNATDGTSRMNEK